MREYSTLRKLRNGEVFNLEGINLIMDEGEINPGDLYIAERNTGPHLLTCMAIGKNCIHPTTLNYAFDTWECVKVKEA